MSLSRRVIEELTENKRRRENGETIAIPWSLPRLSSILPGITQGRINLVSANSKVGKTQLNDFLFLYQPLEWMMKNLDSNISLKVFYFSLEISKEAKIRSAISYKLHKDYGIVISPERLRSLFGGYILDDKVLKIINSEDFQVWLNFIEEHVDFVDNIRHNYGIHNYIKTYAEQNGHYTKKVIDWQKDDGFGNTTVEKREVNDKYIPNNPNEYVIVIVDHLSLLQPSKEEKTLHTAMGAFTSRYMLEARDKWNYCIALVQQQAAASESQQFTNKGDTIVEKLKPSPDNLGDCKLTARDVDLMISLFWPHRYEITEYHKWDLNVIGKYHRELMINLNRHGTSNASIDLYMNGATNHFKELPKDVDEKVYQYIRHEEQLEKSLIK